MSAAADPSSEAGAPPFPLFLIEGHRAFLESLTLGPALPLLCSAPKGDSHPVLVLPGFMAGDTSTLVLRRFLRGLGYAAEPWELGRNLGPHARLRDKLTERVETLERAHRSQVSVIGWSLGGIYAREMAKRMPGSIRQVVTMGSPFANAGRASNASWLFDFISGGELRTAAGIGAILRQPPACPTTSIFTKTDGVVHWKSCLELETDHTENIEVPGSHCGLGMNPLVLYALADRLHQKPGNWRPFNPAGWRRHLYNPANARAWAT